MRRSGRCISMVVTLSTRVTPIMGPPYPGALATLSSVSRIPASALRGAVLDAGSFVSWDTAPLDVAADDDYARDLAQARASTGLDESVLTGEGRVHGRRVAVVACEFDFLAGSIGVAAAERITAAVERATRERLPLLASPSSGGTRMQEGTVAFLQMVKIAAAVQRTSKRTCPTWCTCGIRPPGRGVRVVGFARPCDDRRARRADRVPRPAGVRAPLRRAVSARASRRLRTFSGTA